MPVVEVTFYKAVCDGCGTTADYGDYAAWAEPEGAIEMAEDWINDNDKVYCHACRVSQPDGDLHEAEEDAPRA